MTDDFPRDDRGLRACAWCGETIRNQPATGRLRDYCKQGCREMAYRARREQGLIAAAVADALAASRDSSTDDGSVSSVDDPQHSDSSVDETEPVRPPAQRGRRPLLGSDRVRRAFKQQRLDGAD